MNFKIDKWEEYSKLDPGSLPESPEASTASAIYKIDSSGPPSTIIKNVAYYLQYSDIKHSDIYAAKRITFNQLLNEIEALEKRGPFRTTDSTKAINLLPDELGIVKRSLNALDQIASQLPQDTGVIEGDIGKDVEAPVGSIGARAAVLIGMSAALYGKYDVSVLIGYAKDLLIQFTKKIKGVLRSQSTHASEPTILKKIQLTKKIVNVRLTIMIGVIILLVIVVHYLFYKGCKQKELYYVEVEKQPVHPGSKIMDSIIATAYRS